jgi:hypothetical protein
LPEAGVVEVVGGRTVGSVCVCVRPGSGAGAVVVGDVVVVVVDVVVVVVVGALVGTEATSVFAGAFLETGLLFFFRALVAARL